MKSNIRIKLILLSVVLLFVVYSIRRISSPEGRASVNQFFSGLGVEPGTAQSPGFAPSNRALAPGEERFNICRNRVQAFLWPDGKRVEETKNGLNLRWMAYSPDERELAYLDIEKWLSRHCQIAIRPVHDGTSPTGAFSDYMTLRYIDGTEMKIRRRPDDLLAFGNVIARSPDFQAALGELAQAAEFEAAKHQ